MALSGSQKTRSNRSVGGVGRAGATITAKVETEIISAPSGGGWIRRRRRGFCRR